MKNRNFFPQVENLEQIIALDGEPISTGPLPTVTIVPSDILNTGPPLMQVQTNSEINLDLPTLLNPVFVPPAQQIPLIMAPLPPVTPTPYIPLIGPSTPSEPLPQPPEPPGSWYTPALNWIGDHLDYISNWQSLQ
jgi:hypothetical protein